MTERVEEIRRHWEQQHAIREGMREQGVEPSSSWYDEEIPYLLTALAQAERSAAEFKTTNRLLMGERDDARAEVERLTGYSDALKGQRDRAEADLARVRAALETAANRLDIAASVIRSGAKFARWADEARAALEGRG